MSADIAAATPAQTRRLIAVCRARLAGIRARLDDRDARSARGHQDALAGIGRASARSSR